MSFGSFFAQLQNILFKQHGSTHASHCAKQPIYATDTNNYAQNLMPTITLAKIP